MPTVMRWFKVLAEVRLSSDRWPIRLFCTDILNSWDTRPRIGLGFKLPGRSSGLWLSGSVCLPSQNIPVAFCQHSQPNTDAGTASDSFNKSKFTEFPIKPGHSSARHQVRQIIYLIGRSVNTSDSKSGLIELNMSHSWKYFSE